MARGGWWATVHESQKVIYEYKTDLKQTIIRSDSKLLKNKFEVLF